jgi:hypothetical protein
LYACRYNRRTFPGPGHVKAHSRLYKNQPGKSRYCTLRSAFLDLRCINDIAKLHALSWKVRAKSGYTCLCTDITYNPDLLRSPLVATNVSTKALGRSLGQTRHGLEIQTPPAGSQDGQRPSGWCECLDAAHAERSFFVLDAVGKARRRHVWLERDELSEPSLGLTIFISAQPAPSRGDAVSKFMGRCHF